MHGRMNPRGRHYGDKLALKGEEMGLMCIYTQEQIFVINLDEDELAQLLKCVLIRTQILNHVA
jgi:hypothetical protein